MCTIISFLRENIFIIQKRNPIRISSHPQPLPQPLATTSPLPVSGFACLDIAHKWNRTRCGLWCLLLSLSVMCSRFTHVAVRVRTLLLFMAAFVVLLIFKNITSKYYFFKLSSLEWPWLVTRSKFQACSSVIQRLHVAFCAHHPKSSPLVSRQSILLPPPAPSPW